jgi:CheY-like chemotaxis protein
MTNNMLAILLVEDSTLIRERLSSMLTELKNVAEVQEAGNYEEALGILQEGKTDVVILDIGLPGKTGIDVLRVINQQQWELKAFVLTNQVDNYLKKLCLSLGATDFLDKSKDFDKIPGLITGL